MGSVGILMIAMGHNNYYRMAVNLAASLKANNPEIQIALISENKPESALFDIHIAAPTLSPIECKTRLYDLTPFDRTLFLDADMIWLPDRDPVRLLSELEGTEFTIMNTKSEHCIWADPADVRALTGNHVDPLYIFYSECIYFERSADVYFEYVKEAYSAKLDNRIFAGGMADELAYIIAALKTNVRPHMDNWHPIFWCYRDKKDAHLQPYQLKNKYYAYSIGGNNLPAYAKAHYNNLAKYYGGKMGVSAPYTVQDKRYFLSNRTTI